MSDLTAATIDLTDAERHTLTVALAEHGYTEPSPLFAAVEALLAARLAAPRDQTDEMRALIETLAPRWDRLDPWQRAQNDAATRLRVLLADQPDTTASEEDQR